MLTQKIKDKSTCKSHFDYFKKFALDSYQLCSFLKSNKILRNNAYMKA